MSKTTNFELDKLSRSDGYAISQFNDNMDIIDTEMAKPPLTVNGISPDEERDIQITTVPLADNLTSDEAQINTGEYVIRSSGGEASISNGDAWLSDIRGNMVKTGVVQEVTEMTVTPIDPSAEDAITAVIDWGEFKTVVTATATLTFTFTTSWSTDPSTYGITVSGTPTAGDQIVVNYVKGNRGTITVENPTSFISTGWNLYNHSVGYARVPKYSDEYGFMIDGTYTGLKFASTLTGTQTTISPVNGYFTVPSDGYVFVTGGNATDTALWMTWADWTEEPNGGTWEAYSQTSVDLSGVMVNFPYGLMRVGNVYDEINPNTGKAYSRIERLAYTSENLETVIASGVAYDTDTNYIYAARSLVAEYSISVDGEYTVNDHGTEMFLGTSVAVIATSLYGSNLKNKIERDVLTISAQTLTSTQKAQARTNIGAASAEDLEALDSGMDWFSLLDKTQTTGSYSEKALIADRKLSDYSMIGVMAYRGEWILGTQMLPMSWFLASSGVAILTKWSSTDIEIDVKPVSGSDTSVQVKHITTDTGTIYVRIFAYAKARE